MFKNKAGQKLTVFAFDSTTNVPKTGDAANLTAYVSKDNGAVNVLADTSATELNATNAKGYYTFDLAQDETDADKLVFSAKSTTANIVVIGAPAVEYTGVQLGDVAHGGVNTTITFERMIGVSTTSGEPAMKLVGMDGGAGLYAKGGDTGVGGYFEGGNVNGIGAAFVGPANLGLLIQNSNWVTSGEQALRVFGGARFDAIGSQALKLNATNEAALELVSITNTGSPGSGFPALWVSGNGTGRGPAAYFDGVPDITLVNSSAPTLAAAIFARLAEGSISVEDILRGVLAFIGGKATGGGVGPLHFRDQADTKDRIVQTVDANGNRSATVLDLT